MTELEYWTEQIKRGRISRREFFGRAAALGVGTALASTVLSEAGVAAEPKRGGSAKFGLAHGATTDTGDPAAYPDTGTQVPFWGSMSNGLTEVDPKGIIQADLCESMEPTDKAATWVFKLRKGVTFHNGKSLTPEDVIASYRHHMGPNSKSAVKSVLAAIKDIKADGPNTVIFTLDGGNADFPYLTSDYHIPIMPANADGSADWQSNVRTGPFSFVSWEPGVRAKLKRYPNYHEEGKPYFDDVEFLIDHRRHRAHQRADDRRGALDRPPRPQDAQFAEAQSGHLRSPRSPATATTRSRWMSTVAPFDNNDVRTALKWAIDREEIAKKVFLGHGVPGNDNPIAPSVKFAIDPKPKFSFDAEKAKFHLKKAGLSNLKVDLSAADAAFNGAIDAAVLYQESAKKAGIDINVIREPNDGYFDNVWLKKPWCADYWSGRPTCDWMFSVVYAKGAAWNETKWANPHFNDLLVAARSETDDKKRAEMYAEMQQLVHDDCGQIVILFNNYVEAASKKLAHGEIATNWECDGLKIAKRWWFA